MHSMLADDAPQKPTLRITTICPFPRCTTAA